MTLQPCLELIEKNLCNPAIYTDGSVTTDGCGVGIYITEPAKNETLEYSFKLSNVTNISSVELTAFEKALKIATQMKLRKPIIYTDSKVALRGKCHRRG